MKSIIHMRTEAALAMRKRTDAMVDHMLQWDGCTCGSHSWRSVDSRGNFKVHDWVRVDCAKCGTQVPLGPSADNSDAVRVEIRAAELATSKTDLEFQLSTTTYFNYAEHAGWCGETRVRDPFGEHSSLHVNQNSASWQAGFLAAAIANHEEEP